jgi:predicted RNA-binding protein with PUA-like domain
MMSSSSSSSSPSFFLLKSEPSDYSIHQLERDVRTEWTGVRNYAARNHLRSMRRGDRAFFYRCSCRDPAVVGTCSVARAARPDESALEPAHQGYDEDCTEDNNKWSSVLVEFEARLDPIVTIKELRAQAKINPIIANMSLLKQSRGSVRRLSREEWDAVLDLHDRKERGENLMVALAEGSTGNQATGGTATAAAAKKKKRKAKTTAAASSGEDANAPGYCSDPTQALTAQQLESVVSGTAARITEKELGLRGRRHLFMVGSDTACFYYDGTKFAGKDRERFQQMVDAARSQHPDIAKAAVLLSATSQICRSRTLPQLRSDGVLVQRLAA